MGIISLTCMLIYKAIFFATIRRTVVDLHGQTCIILLMGSTIPPPRSGKTLEIQNEHLPELPLLPERNSQTTRRALGCRSQTMVFRWRRIAGTAETICKPAEQKRSRVLSLPELRDNRIWRGVSVQHLPAQL